MRWSEACGHLKCLCRSHHLRTIVGICAPRVLSADPIIGRSCGCRSGAHRPAAAKAVGARWAGSAGRETPCDVGERLQSQHLGRGGLRSPGGPVRTPLGAFTPDSSPREVASDIIHEAHRRGYSPYQTTAILADAIQESNLNPRAMSPNRLWHSIFQQDASYPGRRNPNLPISEFFNRLNRHGGPSSPISGNLIFWLQQRPGEPSATAALAHGRQAYLREIASRYSRANALYHEITSG